MIEIGVGVIGVGRMGDLFCRLLIQEPQSKLIAISDVNEKAANAAANAYGVPAYPDFREMVARKDIQALVIATPDQFHLGPALAAARAGKHIFIEKPLATVASEARQIVDATEASGVALMVAHVMRFDPRFIIAREAISNGDLGNIVHVYARHDSWISSARYIGGRTSLSLFLGVHPIDIVHFLLDSRVVNVTARAVSQVLSELRVDDSVLSLFEFENGAIGVLENSWIRPAGPCGRIKSLFEVVGTSGRLQVDPGETGIAIYRGPDVAYPGWASPRQPLVYGKITGAYREELAHFLECVATRGKPAVTGEDGLAAVIVADAIDRSLSAGGERITIEW
jgi:predicted dehydrogenase